MRTLIVGAGVGGLITALVLARDGHDVTVLERDAEPTPDDATSAWDAWDRTGVTQFRQPHGFLGGLCDFLGRELPDVWTSVLDTDPVTVQSVETSPDPGAASDRLRDDLTVRVLRRTTFERLVAAVADDEANLDVRRGVAVHGLLTSPSPGSSGGPRVAGVRTDVGDVPADLVIDSGGRRTAAPDWLEAIGATTRSWKESDGFTYFSRWYRTHDGRTRELAGSLLAGMAPGLIALIFPGDDGVFGIAMIGLGSDAVLRRLRDPQTFVELTSRLPALGHWVDPDVSAPISDVIPMGAIQNRWLRLGSADTGPVAGIVNTGDSVMSTNPSLGRGMGLAALMAGELRDIARDTDDPLELARRFDDVKDDRFLPFLWDSVQADADMRAMFERQTGEAPPAPPSDRAAIVGAAQRDMDIWTRWTRVNQLFDVPASCFDDEGLIERARSLVADAAPPPAGMSRGELVDVLTASR